MFALPSDCLRVLSTDQTKQDFKVEGKGIACDSGTLKIRYIRRVEDPNQFDALFVSALAARLAADMAIPLAQSRSLMEDMMALYQTVLAEAKAADSQEGGPESINDWGWLDSRA